MKKLTNTIIILLIVCTIFLQGISIYISNTRATDGLTAGELTQKLLKIQEENTEIEAKVLVMSSYRSVASKAAEVGFETSREFVSLYDPIEVAVNR